MISIFQQGIARRTGKALVAFLVLVLVICIQFRVQILSHFNVLYGDSYDATIAVAILEHWSSTFQGHSHWSQLYYFYPYTNTLAQTDGYFLLGIIYSVIRLFGVDPYLAFEYTNIGIRAIGFVAFLVMSRRVFSLSFGWSLVAASLFILSNSLTTHGQRIQLATVGIAPIMVVLMFYAYKALQVANQRSLFRHGAAAGVMLGAWSITCFYITWFFIFFTTFFALIAFCLAPRASKWALWQQFKASYVALGAVLLIAIGAQLPLLMTYLPKAQETGMRLYETVFPYTIPWHGILQVGHSNLLFGELYNKFVSLFAPGPTSMGEYYNTGFAPILFVFFVAGAAMAIYRFKEAGVSFLWPAIALASLVTWFFTLNIGGYSAWFYIYSFFPGAKALNVVSAYQIFLAIPVILLAVWYLSSATSKALPKIVLVVIVGLLGLEELNRAHITLIRADELAKSEIHSAPPVECSSFYVSGWANQVTNGDVIANIYAHNVSAMLIAEKVRLPTINGMASFNPPDWNFAYPNREDYEQRIKQYADGHKLSNVCKLDLQSKTWSRVW